ncbi:MAG: hypothetical protein V1644_01140 [Candidatus Micrarchaeota archaeon]
MKNAPVLKQLGVNALFWTGIMAIILTLLQSDYYFLLFFIGLVAINFAIILLIQKFAPKLLKIHEINSAEGGELAFNLKPVKYPKVLDEEKHAYLPEYIHLDIAKDQRIIFAGDMARNMLKQLRDSLDQALSTDEIKTTPASEPKPKKKGKKINSN